MAFILLRVQKVWNVATESNYTKFILITGFFLKPV